jgi:dTDP-4-dehydrorhamnose 3,5-epimerase
MPFEIISKHLNGIKVVKNTVFPDERGSFTEMFRSDLFNEIDLPYEFVQENFSISKKNVLRGLHFQWDPPMGKLMRVVFGKAFLVAVDIRQGSPTIGKWFGMEIEGDDNIQVWAPPGFARGFLSLANPTGVQYLCTGIYNKTGESNIRWDDPDIGIEWPHKTPFLSEKDKIAQSFSDWTSSPQSKKFEF